ncbi:hypothetical protein EGI31_08455 [Lacihabitans soyangensis]|uniref:Uncharacterized protein n=1 Tax=Lacihabitans soyangensis TaxID=869394 RepID=A0AAE3KWJ7_9BACT|nr:hypothetical protein [Lacihabitans soyangensis]
MRTDGIYVWNFSGQTPKGYCPGLSGLLRFVDNQVYMEQFDELFYPSKADIAQILSQEYYENLDLGEISREKGFIEIRFIQNAYKGQVFDNKLVLDIFMVGYDVGTASIVDTRIFEKAEFLFLESKT